MMKNMIYYGFLLVYELLPPQSQMVMDGKT